MEKIIIGKIVKPQGLKGECKVYPLTNDLTFFDNLKEIEIDNKVYQISSCVVRFGFAYIMLENIDSIEKAEKFRNKVIKINKDNISLSNDSFLIDDIINFEVVDENDNYIGNLIDVEQYGAADIFVIFANKREYRIPFIKEIVKEVNIEKHMIVVDKSSYEENKL